MLKASGAGSAGGIHFHFPAVEASSNSLSEPVGFPIGELK